MIDYKKLPKVFLGQAEEDKSLPEHALIKLVLKKLERDQKIRFFCDDDNCYPYSHADDSPGFLEYDQSRGEFNVPSELAVADKCKAYIKASDCIVYFYSLYGYTKLSDTNSGINKELYYIVNDWRNSEGRDTWYIPVCHHQLIEKQGGLKNCVPEIIKNSLNRFPDYMLEIKQDQAPEELLYNIIVRLNNHLKIFVPENNEMKREDFNKIKQFVKDCLAEITPQIYSDQPPLSSINESCFLLENSENVLLCLKEFIESGRILITYDELKQSLHKSKLIGGEAIDAINALIKMQTIVKSEVDNMYYIPRGKAVEIINNFYQPINH